MTTTKPQDSNEALKEWISVHDRLPSHSDHQTHLVLVYINDFPRGYMETSMLYPDETWSHLKRGAIVTHWMELPPPPRAREQS